MAMTLGMGLLVTFMLLSGIGFVVASVKVDNTKIIGISSGIMQIIFAILFIISYYVK